MDNIEPKTRIEKLLNKIAEGVGSDGAAGKFKIEFSGRSSNEENTAACNHTYAEIKAAYDSDMMIEARYEGGYVLPMVTANEGQFVFAFHYYAVYGNEPVEYGIFACVYNDDSVVVHTGGEV